MSDYAAKGSTFTLEMPAFNGAIDPTEVTHEAFPSDAAFRSDNFAERH
jgi:hypothetical protein